MANKKILLFIVLSVVVQVILVYSQPKPATKIKAESNTLSVPENISFGFNIHSLPLLTANEISQTLSMVDQCGSTSLVRFWGFSGGDNIDKVLTNSAANMKFIVTLSNFYKQGVNQPWPAPEGNETSWFKSSWKNNGFRDFIDKVTKKYKGNPKIAIWEIMNEPNCTADDECAQAQHQFLKEASDLIAKNDPGKLISPGLQAQNTGGEHFDNDDYEEITRLPNITANTCHMYLETPSSVENCKQALEITKRNNKFFYIGELGDSIGCTSSECTNTCANNKLEERKNNIINTIQEFADLGSQAVIIWQFSPERNSALTCDGASVFPRDPFCNIQGNTQVFPDPGTDKPGPATADSIIFQPEENNLKVTAQSKTGYIWVNLKVFDGETEVKTAGTSGSSPNVSKNGGNYTWTYTAKNLEKGKTYTFIFYNDCHTGCKERKREQYKIGEAQTNQAQPTNKPTPIPQSTTQRCFAVYADVKQTPVTDGTDFEFTVTVNNTSKRSGHIQFFSSNDFNRDLVAYDGRTKHPVFIDKFIYPDNRREDTLAVDNVVNVKKGQTANFGYRVKIDECNELGNEDFISCQLSVDNQGKPSVFGKNCSAVKFNINDISTQGNITLTNSDFPNVQMCSSQICYSMTNELLDCGVPYRSCDNNGTTTLGFPKDKKPVGFCASTTNEYQKQSGRSMECYQFTPSP